MKAKKRLSPAAEAEPAVGDVKLPWTARLWSSLGLPWILFGVLSYSLLTFLGHQLLFQPEALAALKREVPVAVYDRSTSIFLTALAIDILNAVFERQTIKMDCVLLPAFIKGMASTTNILVRFFKPVVVMTDLGRPVVVQRYICWMHTTPSILMLLKMISSSITPKEVMTAIFFDEIMVVTGVAALVTTGWQRVLWTIVTHVAMLPLVPYMHKAFTECIATCNEAKTAPPWSSGDGRRLSWVDRAMEQVHTRPLQLTMLTIYVLNLTLWCTFAVTWDLALLSWISVTTEEVLYLGCDFSAKVLFSSTLMLSSFKGIEARRESAMRVIEGSSKAKLIAELQALLEQKERFMSSVSHELRTPLNGIIGISEGMLSGCCGVLPEGVRRQIYIIRTSGARLLALINDVMDAAALRQNKLVLKQEQVVLRHVVDDVLDLTRSLVDTEVKLVNLVPPRMLVLGDTGRIVQILNNLLGNAAKFTRRGQIRVAARQVEGGRKVAVMVADTGIGIPRNKLATIFLPFEQVDMSISRKYGGFGLGLNIVQELVKAHGGTISVSSIEGKGSAFTFTLPLVRPLGRESMEEGKAAAARSAGTGGMGGIAKAPASIADGSSDAPRTAGAGGSASGSGAPATVSGMSPRAGGGADGDDTSTVLSSSDAASRRAGHARALPPPDAELEQYGELPYNAAELSALASSRPYTQSVREAVPLSVSSGTSGPGAHSHSHSQHRSGRSGPQAAGAAAAPDAAAGPGPASPAGTTGAAGLLEGPSKIVHGPRPFHYTMYKRFLLLSVDDDPVNQNVVKSLLSSTGYEVVCQPSGADALRYVASAPALPDLVLLDCMMPEMDGYEVLQRLRGMTPNVHVPVIMVSAQTEEEHVVSGLDLGADDYVTKPFRRNELLARIRAQLTYGEWDQADVSGVSMHDPSPSTGQRSGSTNLTAAAASAAASAAAASGMMPSASFGILDSVGSGEGSGPNVPAELLGSNWRDSFPGAGGGEQRLILLIDDDDVNQMVLQGMLASQHYRYLRASTGAAGLAYVVGPHNGGIPPDLVLLDCSLPDMSGFDVCRLIRQMYNKQQVPVIMLSARHNETAVVEGLKCGANTYVTKPFRRNELLARIRLHLRSREGRSMAVQRSASLASEGPGSEGIGGGASEPRAAAAAAAGLAADSASGSPGSATASVAGGGGVRTWPGAAVLVVAVADYTGLCRMLLPAEMAALSGSMLGAFERALAAHGAVRVEASSGVMAATVLPPAEGQGQGRSAGAGEGPAGPGMRLAVLHRVGRALLDAAATIAVPGTSTCLQLQAALALGTVMSVARPGAAGAGADAPPPPGAPPPSSMYCGPVLAELLDLARRSPPMTIVTPDAEAQALRGCGATADVRGPLFLEEQDAAQAAAAQGGSVRRLWLVEVHPLSYQYLPPQLLYDSAGALRSVLNAPPPELDLAAQDKLLGGAATPAGSAAPTVAGSTHGSVRGSFSRRPAAAASGAMGFGAGPVNGGAASSSLGSGAPGQGHSPSGAAATLAHELTRGSGSVSAGRANSLGIYGGTVPHAHSGLSSHLTHLELEAAAGPRLGPGSTPPTRTPTGTTASGHTAGGGGGRSGPSGSTASGATSGGGLAGGGGAGMHDSGVIGVTFNLQAVAAAVSAAHAAAGGPSGLYEPHAHPHHSGSVFGGGGGGAFSHTSGSYLYGSMGGASMAATRAAAGAAGSVSVSSGAGTAGPYDPLAPHPLGAAVAAAAASAPGPRAGGDGGRLGVDPAEAAAAEPHIRALRDELALMRQQLQALQAAGAAHGSGAASSGRESLGAASASGALLAHAAAAARMPPHAHGQGQPPLLLLQPHQLPASSGGPSQGLPMLLQSASAALSDAAGGGGGPHEYAGYAAGAVSTGGASEALSPDKAKKGSKLSRLFRRSSSKSGTKH